jgi:hypothetical protein
LSCRPKFQSNKPAKGFLSLAANSNPVVITPAESPLYSLQKTLTTHHNTLGHPVGNPEHVHSSLKAQQTFKKSELAEALALPPPPAALISSLRSGFVPASSASKPVLFPKRQSQGDHLLVLNVSSSLRSVQEASLLALQRIVSFTRLYGGLLTTCAVALMGLLSGVYANTLLSLPSQEELEAGGSLSQQVFSPQEADNGVQRLATATGGSSTDEAAFPSLAAILVGDETATNPNSSLNTQGQTTPHLERQKEGELVRVRIVGKSKPSQPLLAVYSKEACPMPKSLAFANGLNQASTSSSRSSLSRRLYDATGFMRPLHGGLLTSRFGLRHGRMHQGVDLAARVGTPILASASGVVTYSGWQAGYGRLIVLQHTNGVRTKYAHCHNLFVRKGQHIQKGQTIAAVGNTGHSTGAHLHYEVLVNGVAVNPLHHVPIGVQVAGGKGSSLPTG